MSEWFRVAVHPVPEPSKLDTSLRYTDILFGFVIRELFLRLQNWPALNGTAQAHLVVGTVLVLGSWIGFRRSLNRSVYEVKFFNLPFFRFVADQLMLITYFRIAVLIPNPATVASPIPPPDVLMADTTRFVLYVFVLYWIWDGLGALMNRAKDGATPRYPELKKNDKGELEKTTNSQKIDGKGFFITTVALAVLIVVKLFSSCYSPIGVLWAGVIVLLAYRWLKEVRSTWKLLHPPT